MEHRLILNCTGSLAVLRSCKVLEEEEEEEEVP
jgi:hypothetical protein